MAQGYKTKFSRSDDGSSYTPVAGMLDIDPGEESRGSVEMTPIDGTSGYMDYDPSGLRDAGEVSITLIWNESDSGQQALRADYDSDTNKYYQIEYPEGTTVEFTGHITGWGKAVPKDDKITRTVKFKISGKPTVTAGS
ncbi:phage tail tube protein [Microbulbifer sp. MLAF003]|uniref:phage tail tube protein n=1 Tax=unclassified Microbulbifer TaxID=2619833 RepID=UPI0024AD9925|nr:phage tail tube protein [Microbulbifer sp. MLAF003]WHI52984.1 phage tail tube protein [Microbulbifer sp. MLAF003]